MFIGLGLPVLQGYGMTETSPIACANRPDDNVPASVGTPMPGVQVKLGDNDALLIKGPNVMLGYWNNPEATRQIISADGWLNSGDTARIDEQGHVFITGRLKEIIVMSNGEKIPPVDMESAILRDPLFEQVMLLGEGKPYLSVLAVLNAEHWKKLAAEHGIAGRCRRRSARRRSQKVVLAAHRRAVEGVSRATRRCGASRSRSSRGRSRTACSRRRMKLKRAKVMEKFNAEIDRMYAGH